MSGKYTFVGISRAHCWKICRSYDS